MKHILADCRYAMRLYRNTPLATTIAIAVLAIGIAFVSAFVSLYVDIAFKTHPGFEQSTRIATVLQSWEGNSAGLPLSLIERLGDEAASIEAAATVHRSTFLEQPDAKEIDTGLASRQFFSGLRPRLAFGRGLESSDNEPDAEPVAVLSYDFWLERFGGNRDILGDRIEIARNPELSYQGPSMFEPVEAPSERASFRIVGVLADTQSVYPQPGTDAFEPFEPSIWVALERVWPMFIGVSETLQRYPLFAAYVRRAEGVSTEAMANELRARFSDLGPDATPRPGSVIDAMDGMVANFPVQREARRQLTLFLAASVLLALVAAANVSLFLLARAPGRRRELSVRLAVGAPPGRLARQLVTEAVLLIACSAAIGIVISFWLTLLLRSQDFFQNAQWDDVTLLDWRVAGLVASFLLVLALLVSWAPIARIRRLGIAASSARTTARASVTQRVAGTVQIAIAGALGSAAIAFAWYLATMTFGDSGFTASNRYMVLANAQNMTANAQTREIEASRWRESVEAIPGVHAVAFGRPVPGYEATVFPVPVPHPEDPSRTVEVRIGELEQNFVDVLGLRLLHGRVAEGQEAQTAVVNQSLARALWGRDDVVGEVLNGAARFTGPDGSGSVVIGVLEDISFGHPAEPAKPYAFRGFANFDSAVIEAELTAAGLEQALNALNPTELNISVSSVQSLRAMRHELLAADRARAFLTIATTALVVLLAAFGFYGTQRYLVAAGRREYALRAALGAGPSKLGRLVFRRGLVMAAPGLAIGALLAFIVVGVLRDDHLSRDISAPLVASWVILGLIAILVSASIGPAREARGTQPAPLLRDD